MNKIDTKQDFYSSFVECPYKDECSSYPSRCDTCKNNRKKKDYYIPEDWYHPNPWKLYPIRW